MSVPQSIQMLYLIKRKDAWYQLPEKERDAISRQTLEATTRSGGKRRILCDATWSSGECEFFELTEFPDTAAVQKRIALYEEVNLFRYFDIATVLGIEMARQVHDAP